MITEDDAKKRPAFQFYPGDWRKDVELRSCGLAARGLWIDLMCVMHECDPYGHLVLHGKPMTAAKIAGQIGVPATVITKLLAELLENGVARKTEEGAIYSKRMVKDERVRNARAEGGKAGSEHGAKGSEHGAKGGRPKGQRGDTKPPLQLPLEPPPSSSSSSSSSEEPPLPPTGGDPEGFAEFWAAWPASARKQDRKKCAEKWRRKGFGRLLTEILAHVEASKASRQWVDGFEPAPLTYLNGERWADGDLLPGSGGSSEAGYL